MDEKTASALAKRLAAYSATAGVALVVTPAAMAQAGPVDADRVITESQIIYYDFDPDVIRIAHGYDGYGAFAVDLDRDGRDDLQMVACADHYTNFCSAFVARGFPYMVGLRVPQGGHGMNGVIGYSARGYYPAGAASRLTTGEVIGTASQNFYHYAMAALRGLYQPPAFPFIGNQGYAGFRFVGGDHEIHYGWLRLGAKRDAKGGVIYEIAYEATPDLPIAAGDRGTGAPVATLKGTLNQTTFPPEGGTLTFSGTVTNTTNEPEELDLWVVARRPGGGLVGVHRFGSGVVSAGATVTRTVTVRIPPSAPSGTAEVRFHIGSYPRVVDSEAFTITKEPGAPAAEAEGEAAFFAEEEGENVFFAAENASVELAGTHALSVPSPNPSSGRTELTLEVAEAQGVRVEVLDALGRRVALLHDGPMAAGEVHRLVFDGSALPNGVYVVRAVGETFADARVVTLMR